MRGNKMNNPFFRKGEKPLVIAHRGDCTNAPENTRAAFIAGMDAGADGFELDVFLLADNTVIVFHDEDTERLTGVKGDITKMPLEDMQKLSVKGEPIPTLEEILNEFSATTLINIEMKAYKVRWNRRATGTEVAKLIRKCNVQDRVIVTSFDPFMLMTLEKEYPGLQSGFAYDDGMKINLDSKLEKIDKLKGVNKVISFAAHFSSVIKNISNIINRLYRWASWLSSERFVRFLAERDSVGKFLGATVVDIENNLIDSDTVEKFHAKKMSVGTYTFFSTDPGYPDNLTTEQQKERILELAKLNVDWIETDAPKQVREILDS